jgi:hypothetical protein
MMVGGAYSERLEWPRGVATVGASVLVHRADRPWTALGQDMAGCRAAVGANPPAGTPSLGCLRSHRAALRTSGLPRGAARAEAHVRPGRTAASLSKDAAALNEVIRAAAELQTFCETEGWRFCLIGGLAVQRWGEPRETVDVDLTLLTGFGGEDRFVSALIGRFDPRIDEAADFARVNRVLLLRARSGVGLDIALGGLPFEETAVSRSSVFTFPPDVSLRTCSAEDLIVLKAFADRPKDWVDVDGIIIRQSGRIDWAYVRTQLAPLAELKEAPEIMDRLDQRRVELDR